MLYNQIICYLVFTIIFGVKIVHNSINPTSLIITIMIRIYVKKARIYLPNSGDPLSLQHVLPCPLQNPWLSFALKPDAEELGETEILHYETGTMTFILRERQGEDTN